MTPSPLWSELASRLRASPAYEAARARLGSVTGLPIAAAAWVFELLATDLDRRLLVVTPHESEAFAWVEALELFCAGGDFFSAPTLTPYQHKESSLFVRAQEAVALDHAFHAGRRTLVCTPRALFRRLPSRQLFDQGVVELEPGDEIEMEDLARHLVTRGYERRDLVSEVGELAVRGGVLDCFPPGEENPLRLDFFGDTIESIRWFDPLDQRSRAEISRSRLLPLSLFPAGPDEADALIDRARGESAEIGAGMAALIEELRDKNRFPGWEDYLPLVFEESQDLVAAARSGSSSLLTVVVHPEATREAAERHAHDLATDFAAARTLDGWAVEPERLEQPLEPVLQRMAEAELEIVAVGTRGEAIDFGASQTDLFHDQLPRFPREVETARERGERLLVVGRDEHRRRFERLAEHYEFALGPGGAQFVEGELDRGFRLPSAALTLFSDRQIFRPAPPQLGSRRASFGPFLSSLRDLKVGDYIVHEDHGIGQFVGLRVLEEGEQDSGDLPATLSGLEAPSASGPVEMMEIRYRDGQSLLLPPSRLDLVQRYAGVEGSKPRFDRLGGSSWSRTKERVRAGMKEMAADLLRLYAERQLAKAPVMPPDSDLQAQFESAFEYDPTDDQLDAVQAVKEDLAGERPMDRLLCGDVGFGKTEVAMRAAFKVVDGGYQVAVLAPTTILADQHLETFRHRFTDFPVEIEMISRFRSPAEIKEIRGRLEAGKIDILIGTHRLLSEDIRFAKLGLLVVDEEQRFGVAQKEKFKELKKSVHVLAMTATPVPRTLQLSLAGVRDLSTIEMAPRDRMEVETAIVPANDELVREVIENELDRGGQVYYVFNRVAGITEVAARLRQLCPRARLVVGHGQLSERELARRMHAFKKGEYDLLLATTIIENGIDIPNVNTILVHRADRYGLAQLYQLRGRVGRSSRLAYCYLLVPADRVLPEISRKRLEAIREFTELGAGFRVAARDLEIRGAGNLLGAEQSGHIAAVGLETYLTMLEETVRELRGEVVEEAPSVAINLPLRLTIPGEYLADENLRMEIYRKIASSEESEDALLAELADRFGEPPASVRRLVSAAALKRQAEALRLQSISSSGSDLHLRFRKDTRADPSELIRMVSEEPEMTFSPSGVLTVSGVDRNGLLDRAKAVLARVRPRQVEVAEGVGA